MSEFKVGDMVLRVKDKDWLRDFGINPEVPHKVTGVRNEDHIEILGSNAGFDKRCFISSPINNKLNRKLYPNYIEYKGFLVPADFEEEN